MQLVCGNCLEEMKNIKDNSIDLIVTDPPYKLTKRGSSGTMGGYWRSEKLRHSVLNVISSRRSVMTHSPVFSAFLSIRNEVKPSALAPSASGG